MWVLWLSTELVINLPRYCWLLLKSYLDCLEARAEGKISGKKVILTIAIVLLA